MNRKPRHGWLGITLGLAVWSTLAVPGATAGEVRPLAHHEGAFGQALAAQTGNDAASAHAVEAHEGADAVTECGVLAVIADPGDSQKDRKHKWWSSDEGKAEFGLTEAQSRDLEAVFQQVLPEMRVHKADVDKYQQQLTKLLNEAKARESDVVKAIEQLEVAQSALSRTRTIMLYRMYRLLSPEQRAKVQAYYERKSKESDGQSVRR